MGWSCEYEAGKMLSRLQSMETGGLIEYGGNKYYCEVSDREYRDGRIHITVYSAIPLGDKHQISKIGGFDILPGGKISDNAKRRFPFLRNL